ncbi:ferrous iron transport protein A [Pleurocapsales cyanobacterium LEGE 10410]|nr:ferrous iron transport protein A [Pleurocapsales cyanobacterium LEGE 10410]
MNDTLNHRQKRHQRHQGWQFTFCGETSETQEDKGERTQLAAKLAQDKLLFPLSSTQVGDCLVITQILSGKNMVRQLSKNGLILGVEVRVISKTASGSIIVSLGDRQVGLGAGMANKVMVTAIENNY